jgi:hypothetical protein
MISGGMGVWDPQNEKKACFENSFFYHWHAFLWIFHVLPESIEMKE